MMTMLSRCALVVIYTAVAPPLAAQNPTSLPSTVGGT
jgi:hypothetical protein